MKSFQRAVPYNALPLLPPAVDIETKNVLLKIISTSRALARLNGSLSNIPNPHLFLDAIYVREAQASSAVENIVTTQDEVFQALVADKKTRNSATQEVLSYKSALWLGMRQLEIRPLISTNLCISLVQCIKQNDAGIRKTPGTALSNAQGEIVYTPPVGEAVIREKLHNWELFIHETQDYDPLIVMALMHYQFEAIHPFYDGNGRTGRILLLLYLKFSGLLDIPAIYPSDYIMNNKSAYYTSLRGVTEHGDWEHFILYMLDMVEKTALLSLARLGRIMEVMEKITQELKQQCPKIYSKDLVEALFRLPYTKREHLVDANLGNLKTVGKYLSLLEQKGLMHYVKVGKEKLYINHRLLSILQDP